MGGRGGGDRCEVTGLALGNAEVQDGSQGADPMWLEDGGARAEQGRGERAYLGRQVHPRASPSPTPAWLLWSGKRGQSKVHPARDAASRTLLGMCCLEHSWALRQGPLLCRSRR